MSLPERLASIGPAREDPSGGGGVVAPASGGHGGKDSEANDPSGGLMQRIVIIQRDERGYGFTVSGDNPVFVASVKADGAASRAGVQQGDRIVKVNGTLVTNRNHLDVVRLIKSGSYVALALLGKRSPAAGQAQQTTTAPNMAANRDSGGGRVTAPQPVDPDKDRELQQQKINMTRSMWETAKEDFEKLQRQYVSKPTDKLHQMLLEKERTVKALENQLKLLTGISDDSSQSSSNSSRPGSNRFSDSEHGGLDSSIHTWASSLPTTTSDLGSMSDSPQTSPSVSPTPNDPMHGPPNGQDIMEDSMIAPSSHDIITIDDEDIHSEEDQTNDPGPFADIKLLENKPAHMAILLNYLISNSDPAPVLFHIISDSYSRNSGSAKDLRKWAYEIYSTFIAQMAPLCVVVDDSTISQIDTILTTSASRTDNETMLRNMFTQARQGVQQEIGELLADFRNKRDLGMANFYGFQKVHNNMDRAAELKVAEELLIPILEAACEDNNKQVRDREQAIGWALATFLRHVGVSKSSHSAALDRVQSFMMKDKRSIKFPGSRSSRAKSVKGHQFTLQHCYVTTFCNFCNGLIWGVGYQMYQCQSCEMALHKQCVDNITEVCGGKQKKRVSKLIPTMMPSRRYSSNNSSGQSALSQLYQQQMGGTKAGGDSPESTAPATQPYPKEDETDLAGLPSGHSVKSIINRYQELSSPTSPGSGLEVPGASPGGPDSGITPGGPPFTQDRKGSADLNRSGSLNNKGEKGDRPSRRAKSDVDVDPDVFKAINQSGSSSASSLSNRSGESPSQSSEGVNQSIIHHEEQDSDLEVESELPSLHKVLGDDVLKKLKPKEKKRQEVINELFYTERNHLRNLKVLDLLFNRPMQMERGVKVMFDLALALFPNMEEMVALHETFVKDIKSRSKCVPVKEVGDLLLKRFDGEAGEKFRKGCAEYCRNQAFALEALKKQTRKEPKLAQFLIDAEQNPMCRRLQLKDLVPSQMQRLTKYPLLIDSLMKHTQSQSEEYRHLEQAHEKCKHILAYVNQAVKECENYHRLKDIQRKLDTRSIEANTDELQEIKNLELCQHKLVFDGPLTWKLRAHRTVDLHLLLFEDMLVLLQRQDEKYVLKFQSTSSQLGREEQKYSHSPVLRLKNVLARNVATDKKSFFVVNMTDVGAQMYEFTAATSELRIKWQKLINDRVEELMRQGGGTRGVGAGSTQRSQSMNLPPKPEETTIERSKTSRISRKSRSVRNPNAGSPISDSPPSSPPPKVAHTELDQVDGVGASGEGGEANKSLGTSSAVVSDLIQPGEVRVDSAVVVEGAESVRSPLASASQDSRAEGEGSNNSNTNSESANTTSSTTSLQQQQQQPPPPREQLKSMAAEMNTILTKLMGAMKVGAEERHRLRQELAEAQERLAALKDLQRQMTEAGVVPPDRVPILHSPPPEREEDGAGTDIPNTVSTPTTVETESITTPQPVADTPATQQEVSSETVVSSSEDTTDKSIPHPTAAEEQVQEEKATEQQQQQLQQQQQQQQDSDQFVTPSSTPSDTQAELIGQEHSGVVHPVLQEATVTQLEESVEALTLTSSSPAKVTGVIEVALKDDDIVGVDVDNDEEDDDDNNEVSVKDLPLPDVNLPVSSREEAVVEEEEEEEEFDDARDKESDGELTPTQGSQSRLLDAVDLDDTDSEEEGEAQKRRGRLKSGDSGQFGPLEEEEEEGEEGEDASLRKLSASSVDPDGLNVDEDKGGEEESQEGNNNKEDNSRQRPGSSSVDGDTTAPIEI